MNGLEIKAKKMGAGLGLYVDKILRVLLSIEENDKFSVEMKTVKGVKTITLREVK